MAEERKYRLRVEGHLVEVTKDVYLTYYRVERHTKTLDEKDVRNGKVSYSDLDTEETLGEEMVPDPNAESVEDKAVGNILLQELRQCLAQLPLEEQNLIRALYFEELTEREYAKQINISQKAVNKRRHKILSKLRALMKIKYPLDFLCFLPRDFALFCRIFAVFPQILPLFFINISFISVCIYYILLRCFAVSPWLFGAGILASAGGLCYTVCNK